MGEVPAVHGAGTTSCFFLGGHLGSKPDLLGPEPPDRPNPQIAQQAGALMKNQTRLSTTQNRPHWGQVSPCFLLVPIKLLWLRILTSKGCCE